VRIGDARLLFFPVASMAGPMWVSTEEIVQEAWPQAQLTLPAQPNDEQVVISLPNWNKYLNLGWLLFETKPGLTITPPGNIAMPPEWQAIAGRIALVTDRLFAQIVNSNLEVRTSVSIDAETGAAASGALFTYEAIPRATWLWCDVIEDDYHPNGRKFPETERQYEKGKGDNAGMPLGEKWEKPLDVVRAGLKLVEYLGVGGMGTRGFGRMRLVTDWPINGGSPTAEKAAAASGGAR
jgi:CRISPR-associated protein Cmr4